MRALNNISGTLFVIIWTVLVVSWCESKPISRFDDGSVPPNNHRRQLGPIYVSSEEDDSASSEEVFGNFRIKPPSITYATPFEDDEIIADISSENDFVSGSKILPPTKEQPLFSPIIDANHDTSQLIRPNQNLIDIVEKHIQELNSKKIVKKEAKESDLSKKSGETGNGTSSYGVPLSSVVGPLIKVSENNEGPPRTAYGIPDLKSTPYPPYNIERPKRTFEDTNSEKDQPLKPPSRSYGLPDAKIDLDSIFKNSSNKRSIPKTEQSNLVSGNNNSALSSYGVPLNSVLTVSSNVTHTLTKPIAIPDHNLHETIPDRETVVSLTTTTDSPTLPSPVSDSFTNDSLVIDIRQSLSSEFDLNNDGVLVAKYTQFV